jgi:hypothetical protein
MTTEQRIAALEERLQPLRDRIDSTFAELDRKEQTALSIATVFEGYSAKARHVASEALAEMRHIDEELKQLKAQTSVAPSTKTSSAKTQSSTNRRRIARPKSPR